MNNGIAYRMRNTGNGSDKFGPCEVCGKYCDAVYLLVKQRRFTRANGNDGLGYIGDYFGHKSCLSRITNETA